MIIYIKVSERFVKNWDTYITEVLDETGVYELILPSL